MPAPFIDRLRRLATLHNAMATAYADGLRGIPTTDLLAELDCQRKALYDHAEELRALGAPLGYSDSEHLWSYAQAWNFPVPIVETLSGSVGIRLSLDFLLDPAMERDLEGRIAIDPALKRTASATLPRLTGIFAPKLLGPLARALKERRSIRFQYRKPSEQDFSPREVDPLELFEWNGMPYLQARDPNSPRQPFKRYALSRMDRLEVLDHTFRAPPRRQIPSCLGAFCGEVFDAVVVADPDHAPYVRERRWHPSQKTRELHRGAVEFKLPFGDFGEAARWILGQGPGFAPIGPAPLVKKWKEMIRQLAPGSRPHRPQGDADLRREPPKSDGGSKGGLMIRRAAHGHRPV